MELTSELLIALAAAVLSLLFSYIPGLRTWYAAKSDEFKRLFMLGMLIVISGAVFGLGCAAILTTNVACNKEGAFQLVWLLVIAITTNQSTYMLTPKTADVKAINNVQTASDIADGLG